MNIHFDRIESLRDIMSRKQYDVVLVSASDPHKSEYSASRWMAMEWLGGYSGEAGDMVITADHAGLWTDSRYFIQAQAELDGSGVELHKMGLADTPSIPEWIVQHFSGRKSVRVAACGECQSVAFVQELQRVLNESFQNEESEIILSEDLLDYLWEDRPLIPCSEIITLDEEEMGMTRLEKIAWLREFMASKPHCEAILLSSLDQIAWVLNVRGEDIDYNPYVISYLLVTRDRVLWFVKKGVEDENSESDDTFLLLSSQGIEILSYEDVFSEMFAFADSGVSGKVYVDLASLNARLYETLCEAMGEENLMFGTSPVILKKALKNDKEIEGFRNVFFEDGIAVERFLYWLETSLADGRVISEWEAAEKLTSFRAQIEGYRGNSFHTISAYGPGAALPHYCTVKENSPTIRPAGLYLVDSGGQYFYGTTDITRTVPVGTCSLLEKTDYTLVLKAMINLSMSVFPDGTPSCQLDALARTHLWKTHRNYGHGTGHGLGFFSGVHEGPQSIRPTVSEPFRAGMVTSNEPGIYREGLHGVRHENVVLCVEDGKNEFGNWLCFETLTCCHFDTSILQTELLSEQEIQWLNVYNESVYQRLAARVEACEGAEMRSWLRKKTLPIK